MINVTKEEFEQFYKSTKTVDQFADELNARQPNAKKSELITVADIRSACKMLNLNLRERPRGKKIKFNFVDLDSVQVPEPFENFTEEELEDIHA